MPDNSFRNYQDGKPVRHKYQTREELEASNPDVAASLRYIRKIKAKRDGVFLDGFGIITAMVFMDFRLNPLDVLVYVALKLFCGINGHTFVKMDTLCRATGLGITTVRQCIKNLIRCGYVQSISTHTKNGRRSRNEYICNDNPKEFKGEGPLKGHYREDSFEYKLRFEQYGRISKAIFCDEDLTWYAKLVYAALCVLGRGYMVFTGKNAHIALLIGKISRKHIQDGLKQLVSKGYISIYRMHWQSKYVINTKPEEIPYPNMFFCNDFYKYGKEVDNYQEGRIPDLSSLVGKNLPITKLVNQIQKMQKSEMIDVWDFSNEEPDNPPKRTLCYVDELPAEAEEVSPPEFSDEMKNLLNTCEEEDTEHPEMDYGRKYQREIDLTAPKTDYQWALSGLYQRYLNEATEDEKYLTQLIFNGGIPADCAMPGNEKKFLRCLDFLMAPVPGIHTAMENKCLQRSIETLKEMAAGKRTYRINGEKVNKLDLIVSLNRVLSSDDGGISMAGFLQYVSKHAAKKMLCGDVQHFKTSIVHMMETTCRSRISREPLSETDKLYDRFSTTQPPLWHEDRSCWALGASIA